MLVCRFRGKQIKGKVKSNSVESQSELLTLLEQTNQNGGEVICGCLFSVEVCVFATTQNGFQTKIKIFNRETGMYAQCD